MQVSKRKLIVMIVGVSALVVMGALSLWLYDPFISVKRCSVFVPEANETLYFRTVGWGIAGGHWQIVLSRRRGLGSGRAYDTETEYFFDHPDGLLYGIKGKTLEVHSHAGAPVPRRFDSAVTVQLITHDDNPDWVKLQDNRKNVGLTDVDECAKLQEER